MMDGEVLQGGVANAGAVVRAGDHVLRPAGPHTRAIHAFLRHVRANGFEGVPEPVGVDPDGRERLVFIPGDVAFPPYPAWAQTDAALASIAALLARFHAASAGFVPPPGATWARDLADAPGAGSLICHNDVCLENVIFRSGVAVAFVDFEFAAPGRPLWDLAMFARMCVPLEAPEHARLATWTDTSDPARRLRVIADAYGLAADRREFVTFAEATSVRGREFVRSRVERGEPAFVAMWQRLGGEERYARRAAWFSEQRQGFVDRLG
jgi:hypothetical protein